MFFLKTVYFFYCKLFKNYFYKSFSKNNFRMFCNTYKFFTKHSLYFKNFFNKFVYFYPSSKSKFFYIYIIYYICKKKGFVDNYLSFLKLSMIFNKIPTIKFYSKKYNSFSHYFNIFFDSYLKFKFGSNFLNNFFNKDTQLLSDKNYINYLKPFFNSTKQLFRRDLFKAATLLTSYVKKLPNPTINNQIRYNSTSIVKYINDDTNYTLYFLRKNRLFNKGRYSRNRQNYRTGVY